MYRTPILNGFGSFSSGYELHQKICSPKSFAYNENWLILNVIVSHVVGVLQI